MSQGTTQINILCVDDEPDFAELTAEFLKREDERISVEIATSADEGLKHLDESGIDCIVSDYQMPGMNGIEFLETVREEHPTLPFILYTGKGSEEVASEAIRTGVTDYLQKETGTDHYALLTNRVVNAVESHRRERRLKFLETFENELIELSIDFLRIEQQDIDALIDDTLERLGTLVEADRSYVFEIDHDAETFSITHEWCTEGVEPQINLLEDLSLDSRPWWMQKLENFENITIPDVSALPPEAELEQRSLQEQNIESLIATPMVSNDELVGFIGFDWVEEQEAWSDDFIDTLRMASELITSARRREARRRELERHEAYLEQSQDSITVVDEDGTVQFQSDLVEETTGYRSSEILGESGFEYVHPEDHQNASELVTSILDNPGETARAELRVETKEGSWRWVDARGVNKLDDPVIGGIVVGSRNITERKEREAELRELKKEYETVFDTAQDAIFLFDVDRTDSDYEFRLRRVNPTHEALTGLSTEEDRGKTPVELLGEEEGTDVAANYRQCVEAKEPISYEEVLEMPAGTVYWQTHLAPVTKDGEVTQIVGVARDFTERKAYEQKLTALHDVAGDVTTSTSVKEVCERTIDAAEAVLDFDLSVVAIEEDEFLQIKAESGEVSPDDYKAMHVSEGLAGKTYRTGEAFVVGDASTHGATDPQGDFDSILSLPVGEHGNFQAVARERNAFDEDDLELAELLVSHTETALDRLQRERALTALHDAATRLETATSETEICDIVVETAEDLLGFDFINVDVVADDRLELQASSAGETESYQSVPLDAEDNLGVRAYQQAETIVENDLRNVGVTPADSDLRSALTVPIGRFGTFQAGSRSVNAFDETDRELAELLISHTETALDGLQREAILTALHDAATRLETAASETDVYDIVIETAEDILEFDLVAVDIEEDGALIQRAWSLSRDTGGYFEETPLDEDTFATRAFKRQETLLVDDLGEYDITPADPEYRSALTVPIADIGTFQTVSEDVGAFDQTDRELAELLVNHAREALQRLEQERSLRKQRDRLRRENERLDQFASIVSHDLRNPLTVANGELELARMERDSEHLDEVATSLERMETIIEDVLAMARSGQAVEESELDPIDLDDIAKECWGTVETAEADLEVTTEATVWADRDRLRRVLENLVRNAIDHGGQDVTITIGGWDDGFYVADDGTGIPPDDRDSVFEFGYTTTDGGTGFGLAIVKEIVAAHGWSIDVVESDGGGARFEIAGVAPNSTAE